MSIDLNQQNSKQFHDLNWFDRLKRHKLVLVLTAAIAILGGTAAALQNSKVLVSTIDGWISEFKDSQRSKDLEDLVRLADDLYFNDENNSEATNYYLEAANGGDVFAQAAIAKMAFYGWGDVVEDRSQAEYWADLAVPELSERAESDRRAAYLLAFLYGEGIGVRLDEEKATALYHYAADRNYAPAQFNLSFRYQDGDFVAKDPAIAFRLRLSAANQGHLRAAYRVGRDYYYGDGVEKNPEEARKWLLVAAEKGHVESQNLLGNIYESGLLGEVDFISAAEWYRRAATGGNSDGKFNLAELLYYGRGHEVDKEEAINLLRDSASLGNRFAQFLLGLIYYRGDSSNASRNEEESVRLWRLAAEQGHARAQFRLAQLLRIGDGVEPNHEEAKHWFEACSGKVDGACLSGLAIMYEDEISVPKDIPRARSLYRNAIDAGSAFAAYRLANLMEENDDTMEPSVNREILSLYTRASEIDTENGRYLYEVGYLYRMAPPWNYSR